MDQGDGPCGNPVNSTSGIAGVAFWVNEKRKMNREEPLDKRHPIIQYIYDWVTAEYDAGRITMISDDELNAKYEEAVSEIS